MPLCPYRNASKTKKCQFPTSDLFDSYKKELCLLHEPITEARKRSQPARTEIQNLLDAIVARASSDRAIADLTGVQIPDGVTLRGRQLPGLILDEAHIASGDFLAKVDVHGELRAIGAHFQPQMILDESQFRGLVDLKQAVFHHGASFAACTFEQNVVADDARFMGDLVLSRSKVLRCFHATHLEVQGTLQLTNDLEFHGLTDFSGSRIVRIESAGGKFLDGTNFSKIVVSDSCHMHLTRFLAPATFTSAQFKSGCSFQASQFSGCAVFIGSEFGPSAVFDGCAFEHEAIFRASSQIEPSGGGEFSTVSFVNARFMRECQFTNRSFRGHVDFTNATFGTAPDFHGCEIHPSIVFPHKKGFPDTSGALAARAYRTLKLRCEEMRAREEESMFFALEQDSIRHAASTSAWHKTLLFLYSALSDYGRSSARALLWLLGMMLLMTLVYALWASPEFSVDRPISFPLLRDALIFSIEQTVNPFWVFRKSSDDFWSDASIEWVKLVATLHSVGSIVLVTLFVLAIRWRFKRE